MVIRHVDEVNLVQKLELVFCHRYQPLGLCLQSSGETRALLLLLLPLATLLK